MVSYLYSERITFTILGGLVKFVGGAMSAQAAIGMAAEQARITVGQTQQANINKMGDFASQAYQAMQDAMNSMIQVLDKTVDATFQANQMH